MVKITKNNKKPEKNVPKKVSNGNKKEGKEKHLLKRKVIADGKEGSKASKINAIDNKINEMQEVQTNKSSIKKKLVAESFDETQFESLLSLENIKDICKALKKLVEDEVTKKKTSIFSDYRYFLNVASYKIPNCPKRMVKLDLKHSLVDPNEDDIVLIVPDLQRGAKVDYEPTIQHYEDLLQECGVKGLKIMPFNQLRNEYTTFEAKRKLANTYDYFLCDGRIAGHVVGFCGKIFQKPRTTIHSVRFNDSHKLKANIEKSLKRTSFKQLHKGDVISIPVGSDRFTLNQLGENIRLVIDQLKKVFPGGYPNIRNMYMKIDIKGTSALPLYVNLAGPPTETPNVIGLREKRMLKLKKQANEVLSKFNLSKTGDFVKLNKSQVERKQNIRDARVVLLSKENDANDTAIPPTKKIKRDKSASSTKSIEGSEDKNVEDLGDMNCEEENDHDSENTDEEK